MQLLASDPWIAAQIDEVVAPYVGRLPARDVAWIRDQLAETLIADEHAARLLKAAHPRDNVDESGEIGGGRPEDANPNVSAAPTPVRSKAG
jgi:hypothetical protein